MTDPASSVRIRHARAGDADFLWEMLRLAAGWRGEPPPAEALASDPHLRHYVVGWTPDQLGVVAEEHVPFAGDGHWWVPVGAAWLRDLDADDPGFGFVRDGVPELAMAVRPGRQEEGIGRALLDRLLAYAQEAGVPGVSLSVEHENVRAAALYRSAGFRVTGRVADSDTMLVDLTNPADGLVQTTW